MEKILLHACCAVCLGHPLEVLKKDYEPVVFFYNPNISPQKEHDRRLEELVKYCEKNGFDYVIGDYEPQEWVCAVKGLENEPEKGLRCEKCFALRMDKTAEKAKELGINIFTTTLSVSPHKVSSQIFGAIQEAAQNHGLDFIDVDFKKQNGFKKTMEIAKEQGFYRQDYCGCKFSIRH